MMLKLMIFAVVVVMGFAYGAVSLSIGLIGFTLNNQVNEVAIAMMDCSEVPLRDQDRCLETAARRGEVVAEMAEAILRQK